MPVHPCILVPLPPPPNPRTRPAHQTLVSSAFLRETREVVRDCVRPRFVLCRRPALSGLPVPSACRRAHTSFVHGME